MILGIILLILGILLFGKGISVKNRSTKKSFNSIAIILVLLSVALSSNYYSRKDDSSAESSVAKSESGQVKSSTDVSSETASSESSQVTVNNQGTSSSQLASLNFDGNQEIIVNKNDPGFTPDELSLSKGAWQEYQPLDTLNRVTEADALLNKSLMPTEKREPLYVNPTGWHNKKIKSGWLYNRSHLIGFQLSGQNNNLKNLMTGTRSLNSPFMLLHEDDIAHYLKQNNNNYIRYQVKPIFRGDELLARGVQMRAQSIGNNTIRFNVFIFNVQAGATLNYTDGTSVIN